MTATRSSSSKSNGGSVLRIILTASVTLNVSFVGWYTAHDVITREELKHELNEVDFPWPADRPEVMYHLRNPRIHQDNDAKTERILRVTKPYRDTVDRLYEEVRELRKEIKE